MDEFPTQGEDRRELRKIFFEKIPVKKPIPLHAALFEKLVSLIQSAKRSGESAAAQFLEDLIDACVMECYFREHMAQRDLLFLDDLAPHLVDYEATTDGAKQREFLANLHRTSTRRRQRSATASSASPPTAQTSLPSSKLRQSMKSRLHRIAIQNFKAFREPFSSTSMAVTCSFTARTVRASLRSTGRSILSPERWQTPKEASPNISNLVERRVSHFHEQAAPPQPPAKSP